MDPVCLTKITTKSATGNYGNSLAVDLSRLGIIASVTMLFPLTGACV